MFCSFCFPLRTASGAKKRTHELSFNSSLADIAARGNQWESRLVVEPKPPFAPNPTLRQRTVQPKSRNPRVSRETVQGENPQA